MLRYREIRDFQVALRAERRTFPAAGRIVSSGIVPEAYGGGGGGMSGHPIDGSLHTAAGLTVGRALIATGETTFAFADIGAQDVTLSHQWNIAADRNLTAFWFMDDTAEVDHQTANIVFYSTHHAIDETIATATWKIFSRMGDLCIDLIQTGNHQNLGGGVHRHAVTLGTIDSPAIDLIVKGAVYQEAGTHLTPILASTLAGGLGYDYWKGHLGSADAHQLILIQRDDLLGNNHDREEVGMVLWEPNPAAGGPAFVWVPWQFTGS